MASSIVSRLPCGFDSGFTFRGVKRGEASPDIPAVSCAVAPADTCAVASAGTDAEKIVAIATIAVQIFTIAANIHKTPVIPPLPYCLLVKDIGGTSCRIS